MKKLIICMAIGLMWSGFSYAGSCNTISCDGIITNLYPNGQNGKIYIDVDAVKTPLNCNLDQGNYIVLKDTNLRHSEIYAMLLSVAIAGKEVRLRMVDNSPDCELRYTMLLNNK